MKNPPVQHSSWTRVTLIVLLAALCGIGGIASSWQRALAADTDKPAIVLVHGAFADGSSWSKVIPMLEKDGYRVIAVQNPLASFAEDVATTRRVIEAQTGPVVAVGHSYGGAVITSAAAGAANVKALVYVAAFAPDADEVITGLIEKYPSKLGTAMVPDAAGFLFIDRAKFKEVFAADASDQEISVLAATQKPIKGDIFGQKFEAPAWKQIPSWFMVAKRDQVINPDLERFFAKRMGATTREVDTSHVPFISKPQVVVEMIEEAANAAQKASAGMER
jgi:pimeloyl-ACP methyl ester carboxylesterase